MAAAQVVIDEVTDVSASNEDCLCPLHGMLVPPHAYCAWGPHAVQFFIAYWRNPNYNAVRFFMTTCIGGCTHQRSLLAGCGLECMQASPSGSCIAWWLLLGSCPMLSTPSPPPSLPGLILGLVYLGQGDLNSGETASVSTVSCKGRAPLGSHAAVDSQ